MPHVSQLPPVPLSVSTKPDFLHLSSCVPRACRDNVSVMVCLRCRVEGDLVMTMTDVSCRPVYVDAGLLNCSAFVYRTCHHINSLFVCLVCRQG